MKHEKGPKKSVARIRSHVYMNAWEIARKKDGIWNGYFTVGEVYPVTEYSRPTVQKYVDLLVGEKLITKISYPGATALYRFGGEE